MYQQLISRRLAMLLCGAAYVLALLGCSSGDGFPRVAVQGKVTLQGQPLTEGVIRFVPGQGVPGPTAQAAVKEGKYALDARSGPIAGKHRVEIEATNHLAFALDDEAAFQQHMQTKGALPPNPVPPQFNTQSTLTADIPAHGSDDMSFHLLPP